MRQSIRTLLSLLGCLAANALASDPACTPITSIPVVISAPGTYCVMGYLYTTQTSGAANSGWRAMRAGAANRPRSSE